MMVCTCWSAPTLQICPQPCTTSADGGTIGLVERHQILTEGQCFALVTLYFPATVVDMMTPRKKMAAIVWYSQQIADAGSPPRGSNAVGCGRIRRRLRRALWFRHHRSSTLQWESQFGWIRPRGPGARDWALAAWVCVGCVTPGERGGWGRDGAQSANTDVDGQLHRFHAGEIARVHTFLTQRTDISGIALAVADDHIDAALLHQLLCTAHTHPATVPAKLAIVSGQVSYAAPAQARLYSPVNYYSWIFAILTACACHHDCLLIAASVCLGC